jgi:hypothetical protein
MLAQYPESLDPAVNQQPPDDCDVGRLGQH